MGVKTTEPAWVKDEDVWAKAKKTAGKSGAEDPWALTTYLYKRMGGKTGKSEEAGTPEGAIKGWETRRAGHVQKGEELQKKADAAGSAAAGATDIHDAKKKGAAYRKAKQDVEDHARYTRAMDNAHAMGAKGLEDYIAKAKAKGYSVPKKDETTLRRAFKKFHKESEVVTGHKAQPGVHVPFWFWGCEAFTKKKERQTPDAAPKKSSIVPPKADHKELPPTASAAEQVQKILVETPEIPAAAMVQALKAKGLEIVDQKQADSATSQAQLLKNQESAGMIPVRARFLESWKDNGVGPTRFKVALIQEGMGNLRDAFYYTRKALESGVAAFEGKKCFADHPSRSEESDRPERSVRDIVGHFENVHVEERDDGGAMLCADLVLLPDPSFEWARGLVRHALEYSKKYQGQEFIGLSINASGDAQSQDLETFLKEGNVPDEAKPKLMQALKEGITTVRVVDAIQDAVSTDLVTEPGARGKVLEMLESERKAKMAKKMKHAEDEAKKQSEAKMKQDEAKHAEEEAKQAEAKQAEDGEEKPEGEDHEDEEQDKALILDMIKKHMGEACEGMESEGEEAAHQAYEAYKEMGKSHEEAMKCAAEAMKLAKHMAKKQEAKAAEAEGEEKKEEESEESEESEEAKHSEAEVRLTAKIALLERELKGYKLATALDKKLAESKLGRAETDKIRALIGTPKSEAHIVETIKVFKEAFSMAGGSESVKPSFASLFITGSEKQDETLKAKISFSECVK